MLGGLPHPGGRVPGPGSDMFGDEERAQVLDVLDGGHLSRYGEEDDPRFRRKVLTLEQEVAAAFSVRHALATTSGTACLLLALLAAGIGEGDEVLVPGYTYVATMGAIVHARAVPVLVEVDDTLTIDPEDLQRKVNPRTRAILAVHMLGAPCDMEAIAEVASKHELVIIEDACQAAGGSFRGRRLGTFGDVGAFSLNRYKIVSAGEGGLLVTDNTGLYERAFALHDQGHRPVQASKQADPNALLGLNFKMNELTGAVALAQVRKLDQILDQLRQKKQQLRDLLPALPGVTLRRFNDPAGECATVLVVFFDDPAQAAFVAEHLGTRTLTDTGWHVYRNMQQLVEHRTPLERWSSPPRYASPGSLPRTDELLARAVALSVGVVDSGLGTGFGISLHADDAHINAVACAFEAAYQASTMR
jgi:dTDP-4-amino-4,6-dideoxygalactose transaminase